MVFYVVASLFTWRGVQGFAVTKSSAAINSLLVHDTDTRSMRHIAKRLLNASAVLSLEEGDVSFANPFAEIYDKTLLSIQHCINAYSHQQQSDSKVVFIDGSWYHKPDPTTGHTRNPSQEYTTTRIPNARYLDIDAIATTNELFPTLNPKSLPHMMPPSKLFALAMDAYNIDNDDHVIIYARRGSLFTPRVWFLFVSMGHDPKRVHLMQGSLEDYIEEGGLVEETSDITDDEQQQHDRYHASMGKEYIDCFDSGILNVTRLYHKHYDNTKPKYISNVNSAMNVCEKEEVLEAVNDYLNNNKGQMNNTVILDTRGSGYAKNGHIPSAIHLPYKQIATSSNALKIQQKSTLKKLFEEREIDYLDQNLKIILSCGSGV